MSAVTTQARTTPGSAFRDALILAWRNYKHHERVPSLAVFALMTPLIFLLLFRYVIGGPIVIPGVSYVDFLVPGVIVQAIAFGATQTGVGLALDLGRGITDRFRALPISRSAVPAGRALADTVRNALVAFIAVGLGLIIGFRPDANVAYVLAAIGIAVAFGYAFSWVAAFVGLTFKHVEAVHDAGFVWVIPLTFASSALVPVDSMPTVVQWFADVNPVTSVADATRALMLGDPAGSAVFHSALWIAALLIVFVPLTVRAYQRR
jgi:ABC-2 type transport system permease protein